METIKQRSILKFALLNIITFGIWGVIESYQVGRDIDELCDGDGEENTSYIVAWLLGFVTLGIYHEYWWYKQVNRLKLNAGRYHVNMRESGLTVVAFRTWGNLIKNVLRFAQIWITVLGSMATVLFSSYGMRMASGNSINLFSILFGGNAFIAIFKIIGYLTPAWSILGYVGLSFVFHNLNRIAEVSNEYESLPYDPTGYEYYHATANYPEGNVQPAVMPAASAPLRPASDAAAVQENDAQGDDLTKEITGTVLGLSGTNKGYGFKLRDGEEIIIGKDPAVSNVIVDPKYREISRKHCSIAYVAADDAYQVTDYSVNGTFVNGNRIPQNMKKKVPAGSEITLGKTDNKFKLG